jgi:hypothetical protein
MAETLADFARRIGVTPDYARQMKRRGRIVVRDEGFELLGGTVVQIRDSVTEKCDVTASVTSERDSGVTECDGCAELRERIERLERIALEPPRLVEPDLRKPEECPPWGA